MTRSMLYSRALRGIDGDAGGTADLQTDVMRFIAILSLCLVAIFALVQSIPDYVPVEAPVESAEVVPEAPEPEIEPVVEPEVEPVVEPIDSEPVFASYEPELPEPVEPAPAPVTEPTPQPVPAAQPTALAPAAAETQSDEPDGFTLQFETDDALSALVARNEVSLFAISGKTARKLSLDSGRPQFHVASVPSQFHEMDASTVPDGVTRALRFSGYRAESWGVTLPPAISSQLNELLGRHKGGALLIDATGQLRLDPS